MRPRPPAGLRLVGHKGADLIHPGNTVASYVAGAEHGANTIEVDVLWTREGHPRLPPAERAPLICAHDWDDAASRDHLLLEDALDAFTRPPLDTVEIDLDLKLVGREEEVVAAVVDRGLADRTIVTTMYPESIRRVRALESRIRGGWSYPRVTRDWTAYRAAAPAVAAALALMRLRLPRAVARDAPALGVGSIWVYHRLASSALARAAAASGLELVAWTVDDLPRMRRLLDLGVTGLVSNDPRLFASLPSPR